LSEHRPSLRTIAALFLRLSTTGFGGPAAHIAMMHREVVMRRRWVDDQRFLDYVGMTNLIPGPSSTEMAMLVGRHLAGGNGLLVAGISFIVPAAVIVLGLAWSYVTYGSTPTGEALLYGIEPVVIAIVTHALISLAPKALSSPFLFAIGGATAVLYLVGVNELLLLAAAALAGLARGVSPGAGVIVPVALGVATASRSDVTLSGLFLVLLKVGGVMYGSGYVLLAFLRGELVERLAWLTEQELLDAIAIGQLTPGPLFTTATFVGYIVAGVAGAVVATVAIFLPSFVLSAAIGRFAQRLRSWPPTAGLLDGVTASALGLMAGVVLLLIGRAIVDISSAVIALLSFGVLWRFDLNSAWVIAFGALAGVALAPFR
jgi:chromate transporter